MPNIPQEKTLESSFKLLREGYTYIQKRCEQYQSDIFETRFLGEKTVCIHGAEAAALFYDTEKFQREGAIPGFIKKSLFGEGSVQSMDNGLTATERNCS